VITPLTKECEWRLRLDGVPRWEPPRVHTLVIAPHPDDETLAAGGFISALRSHGVPVTVVAVTDGEHAYGETPGLAELRAQEQTSALRHLGVDPQHIHRLHFPDRDVTAWEPELVRALLPLVSANSHIVAPWPNDFHPDHEACGRAAETVARQMNLLLTSYLFWTWHRGTVEVLDGLNLVSFPLLESELCAKHQALSCHASQLHHTSGEPILPPNLLEPVGRPYEIFLPYEVSEHIKR
jgi:LmbE family N-acetylglucosaminyl deacetylase